MKGKKGAYFMIVLTLMLFFILSYMYYLFYIDPDTEHLTFGSIGNGIIDCENRLQAQILIIEKDVDAAVASTLLELSENAGVSANCNSIWGLQTCQPNTDLIKSRFRYLFFNKFKNNLGQITMDDGISDLILSEFEVSIDEGKIRIYGNYPAEIGIPSKDGIQIVVKKNKSFDKTYNYDLNIYQLTYNKYVGLDKCPDNDKDCKIVGNLMEIEKKTKFALDPIIN